MELNSYLPSNKRYAVFPKNIEQALVDYHTRTTGEQPVYVKQILPFSCDYVVPQLIEHIDNLGTPIRLNKSYNNQTCPITFEPFTKENIVAIKFQNQWQPITRKALKEWFLQTKGNLHPLESNTDVLIDKTDIDCITVIDDDIESFRLLNFG